MHCDVNKEPLSVQDRHARGYFCLIKDLMNHSFGTCSFLTSKGTDSVRASKNTNIMNYGVSVHILDEPNPPKKCNFVPSTVDLILSEIHLKFKFDSEEI